MAKPKLVSDLERIKARPNHIVEIEGNSIPGDTIKKQYIYKSESLATADGYTIIQVLDADDNPISLGRWHQLPDAGAGKLAEYEFASGVDSYDVPVDDSDIAILGLSPVWAVIYYYDSSDVLIASDLPKIKTSGTPNAGQIVVNVLTSEITLYPQEDEDVEDEVRRVLVLYLQGINGNPDLNPALAALLLEKADVDYVDEQIESLTPINSLNIENVKRVGDVVYNIVCQFTGEIFSATKATVKYSGIAITDGDVDNIIFFKEILTGEYFVRNIVGSVNVRWFGAKRDVVTSGDFTALGTDSTVAFQLAINYLLASGGGKLFVPKGYYLINGTVYINPVIAKRVPIAIAGENENTKIPFQYGFGGSVIFRNVTGDIFKTNLNSTGGTVIPFPIQYTGLSVSGLAFVGARPSDISSPVLGIKAFNIYRTVSVFKNCSFGKMDYGVYQAEFDSLGNENYCDKSVYQDLYFSDSTLSGLRLEKSDSSTLINITCENVNPSPTFKGVMEIYNSSAVSIIGGVFYTVNGTYTPIAGSAHIRLQSCLNSSIKGIHMEYIKNVTCGIILNTCKGTIIESIHTRWENNDTFKIHNCDGVSINGWTAWDVKNSGFYDISFTGTNTNVFWRNISLAGIPYTFTPRSIITNGVRGTVAYDDIYTKTEADLKYATLTAPTKVQNGALSLIVGADDSASTLTTLTQKLSRNGFPHYDNAQPPVTSWIGNSLLNFNVLSIGGGSSIMNAATTIAFFTGLTGTTTAGIQKMLILSNGNIIIQTGGTFTDAGYKFDIKGTLRVSDVITVESNILPLVTNTGTVGSSAFPFNVVYATSSLFTNTITNVIRSRGSGLILSSNGGTTLWAKFAESTGNLGIETTTGSITDIPSAKVFINSTTQGVLLPRMTTTQRDAIASPVEGLTIFNTTLHNTNVYDGTRWTVVPNMLTGSATLDFPSTAAQSSSDLTITVSQAEDGDAVVLGVPNAATNANSSFTAWVSAPNTVKIRHNNYSASASDPVSGIFKVKVIKN